MLWSLILSGLGLLAWLIPLGMLFIVPVNRKPSSATAWLLLAFALPFVGLAIFLLIGNPKLPRKRREEQRQMNELIEQVGLELREQPGLRVLIDAPWPTRYEPLIRLMTNLGALPAFSGNQVELLPDYGQAFQEIAAEIDRACEYVSLEYFALCRDEETELVFTALLRAHRRGVKVRVLLDQLGSHKYPRYRRMRKELAEAGIAYHLMLPISFARNKYTRIDLRNHRKIVVVDGHTAFTGSQNMIKRTYFRKDAISYDELVVKVSGPVAIQFQAVFLTDWCAESGEQALATNLHTWSTFPMRTGQSLCQVLPSGSGFEYENNLKLFVSLFYQARQRVVITNPYFVPDDALTTAIISAAQRGVEIVLINSEASDQFFVSHAQRSYYEELLKAGVKIYWYPAPLLLHAKHFSVDDDLAVIGSSNLDMRSFHLNMEVTLICYDSTVVAGLRSIEAGYLRQSRQIELSTWQQRSIVTRLAENIARLTSALQ